ncbi:hypothetical protein [Rheinheimera sp. NSM]|uniref:hypothetical protein n=1 Tax=Rheinheimera sp. NSM TaxID=3457884 RepID=UPI0040371AF4
MRVLILCSLSLWLPACGSQQQSFDSDQIGSLYIADFVSDAPEQCRPTDVDLSNIEVKQFFKQAREVAHKILHDHYNYAPCAIEGTLKYGQQSCNWQVRAGATGHIQCGEEHRYFACDDCAALFNTGETTE